ncbi:MAG: hypothetical protein JW862_04415 [Anaerolineales bacterium]|nr:hypothetical protein [Anaerolineales bacterium]
MRKCFWLGGLVFFLLVSLSCNLLGQQASETEEVAASASAPAPTASSPPASPTTSPSTTLTPTETPTPAPYPDDTPLPQALAAPLASAPQFTQLDMLTELDGWAISEQAVLRTTDGGLSWYDLTPAGVTDLGYGTGFTALDDQRAWLLVGDPADPVNAGTLYHTTDGGLNWQAIPVPFGSGALSFVNPQQGWLMLSLGVGAGSMAVAVFRTEDGGSNWQQVYTNDPNLPEAGDSLPLGGLKSGITALDRQTAWVYGTIYAPGQVYLYKTVDGGQSWMQQSLPLPANAENSEIVVEGPAFFSLQDGLLALRLYGEAARVALYWTRDGGITWQLAPALVPEGRQVVMVDMQTAFIWDGRGFPHTRDGGNSWQAGPPNLDFGDQFASMDFVNASTGWVLIADAEGQRSLYKTTDAGQTWFQLNP